MKTKDSCFIKTEDIIKSGIDNYYIKNIDLEFDNVLYIQKIYDSLDKLFKNTLDSNTIIFKDATASGLQNYGILLGYKEDKLEYLNINGSNWCDTYQYIIDKFLQSDLKKWFKRQYWKGTIMTIPYNAVWFTCFQNFLNSLRKDDIEYDSLPDDQKNLLISMHKKFYIDVKANVKKEFYENKSENLKIFKYNKWSIVNKKDYKINYQQARDKYTDILYMITEDEEATVRALEANNIHYLDSELVKKIIGKFDILSIHDCFGIRLCELHLVMDEINVYYSEKVGKSTYCMHIIK